jgi:hypothetical protein
LDQFEYWRNFEILKKRLYHLLDPAHCNSSSPPLMGFAPRPTHPPTSPPDTPAESCCARTWAPSRHRPCSTTTSLPDCSSPHHPQILADAHGSCHRAPRVPLVHIPVQLNAKRSSPSLLAAARKVCHCSAPHAPLQCCHAAASRSCLLQPSSAYINIRVHSSSRPTPSSTRFAPLLAAAPPLLASRRAVCGCSQTEHNSSSSTSPGGTLRTLPSQRCPPQT